jgi:hypothetical protein
MQDDMTEKDISVITNNPEKETWYYASKLASLHYVERLLKQRIDNKFFELDIPALMNIKHAHDGVEIYQPIEEKDVTTNAEEIVQTVRQAIEFYRASQSISLYTKPILLYYCYLRLGRILFLATYKPNYRKLKTSLSHGLSMDNDVKCMGAGSFSRFHDSYDSNPSIYLDGCKFDWRNLLEPPIDRFRLFQKMANNLDVTVKENKSNNPSYPIDELTREYLFVFSINYLARYKIDKWTKVIEGTSEDIIWRLEGYLNSIQSFFPNLILNKLMGKKYLFYPESRVMPDNY